MLYTEVVPAFESLEEFLKCDHSNSKLTAEQYFLLVLFITLYKVFITYESSDEILRYVVVSK